MYLPQVSTIQNSRSLLRAFGGLNETYSCTEAEYGDGINWSSRDYPALSTRIPRRKLKALDNVNGMYHLNGLLTVTGTTVKYEPDDFDEATVLHAGAVTDGEKQLVGMGTKILIWPDKKMYDTASGELTGLGAEWSGQNVTFAPCDMDGTVYTVTSKGPTTPEDPADGQIFLFLNNADKPWSGANVLERYSAATSTWFTISLDYCRIEAEGIGEAFSKWDTITLSGAAQAVRKGLADDLEGDLVIYDKGDDWLVVKTTPAEDSEHFYGKYVQTAGGVAWTSLGGGDAASFAPGGTVEAQRRVPDLEYVTECANRVWGCSSAENVIYACKLGDPTNWYSYRGIASDSYAVTVGSDGAFTGAASCMGYVLFFKEATMHKIYGSKPSDFQVSSLRCRGVARNAAKSMCVINEALYYLSSEGVMAWDGSLPDKVSAALDAGGIANATRAVGGVLDGRYYLHLSRRASDGADENRLLVYDTERGVWHEEGVASFDMVYTGRQLYMWDGTYLWATDPSRESDWATADPASIERTVRYDWISGEIGLDNPDDKYISRVTVRLDTQARSTVRVQVSYDGGEWQPLGEIAAGERWVRMDMPGVPYRHDTLRLRVRGDGQVTLRSIAFTLAASRGKIVQGGK